VTGLQPDTGSIRNAVMCQRRTEPHAATGFMHRNFFIKFGAFDVQFLRYVRGQTDTHRHTGILIAIFRTHAGSQVITELVTRVMVQSSRKTAFDQGSRSDRLRYHDHGRWTLPPLSRPRHASQLLPLARR